MRSAGVIYAIGGRYAVQPERLQHPLHVHVLDDPDARRRRQGVRARSSAASSSGLIIGFSEGFLSEANKPGIAFHPADVAGEQRSTSALLRFMIVGMGLMALLVIFRPQGIFGDKREHGLRCPADARHARAHPARRHRARRSPAWAKPDPILTVLGRAPGLRRHRRRRRRPRRGPARLHHGAHRSQRRRQDHVLQPADRVRPGRHRPLELRREGGRRPGPQGGPPGHGPHVPAHQERSPSCRSSRT